MRDVSWNLDLNIIASGSEDKSMMLWQINDSTFTIIKNEKFEGPVWRI